MTKKEYVKLKYDSCLASWANIAFGIGALAVLSLIPLDYLVTPENFKLFLGYRVITALVLFVMLLLNRMQVNRQLQSLLVVLAGTVAAGMVAMMIMHLEKHQSSYFAGIILVIILICGFVPLPFITALIASIIIYGIYVLPILMTDTVSNLPFFLSANTLIIVCATALLILRLLSNRKLIKEFELQYEVEQQKGNLEGEVMERTEQLNRTIDDLKNGMEERGKMEIALKKAAEDWRATFDAAKDMILMLDKNFNIIKVNRSVTRVFGRPFEELTGKNYFELVTPADQPVDTSPLHTMKETCSHEESEWYFQSLNSWFRVSADPIFDESGELNGAALLMTDITEIKKMQDAILDAKNDWEDSFNTINDAITIHDMDFNIIRANAATETMLGKSRTEILTQKCFTSYHGTGFPPKGCPGRQTLKSGLPSVNELFEPCINKYVEIKVFPRFDRNNQIIGLIHVVKDITEKKKSEEELLQAQKIESAGQLAGGVAHDFNNILSAIIGFANLLLVKMNVDDPLRVYAAQILASSESATRVTQSLLAFSGKQMISLRPLNLNEAITKVEKLLRRLIGEDITLKLVLTEKELTVMADQTQIEQVLINLAAHARNAMPKGGQLTISTEIAEVDAAFVKLYGAGVPGKYALVSVADTGEGMDEKTREKIFEPFLKTKEMGRGTGLGLAIVYGVVKRHNGFINLLSKPPYGSVFKIYLPLAAQVIAEDKRPDEPGAPLQRGTETVLVAEDDPALRKLSRTVLEQFGYKVVEAEDGEDAIQKYMLHRDAIQLIILDMIMPNKDGKEVSEHIRKIQPDIKILFVSGYTSDIIHANGILEEGADFIQKPVSPRELLRKVRIVLDRR